MSSLPFLSYDIGERDGNAILDIYDKFKITYSAEFDTDFIFNFTNLELFRNNGINQVGPTLRLISNQKSFYLTFVEVSYTIGGTRYSTGKRVEFQTWGTIFLKGDYGHILIKPETFLDKVHELINPVELNFEDDKEFSKKFYVVTNDQLKATLQLTQTFREHIRNIQTDDFLIEIIDNKLIIGNKKIIEPAPAIAFAEFMNGISKLF